ncbi:MAG: dsRBD fold-containing protein [Jatrophihabitans sp.]|uniref:dsRBD fold-containing protein n=1 Tax=Jatrophihabitans sp. TaxID=1932789 RepID=UPI003F80EF99
MTHTLDWRAVVHLSETDDSTLARVVLHTGDRELSAEGLARRRPSDTVVPEIGDELAVGRALIELGERLVRAAADDITALGRTR